MSPQKSLLEVSVVSGIFYDPHIAVMWHQAENFVEKLLWLKHA